MYFKYESLSLALFMTLLFGGCASNPQEQEHIKTITTIHTYCADQSRDNWNTMSLQLDSFQNKSEIASMLYISAIIDVMYKRDFPNTMVRLEPIDGEKYFADHEAIIYYLLERLAESDNRFTLNYLENIIKQKYDTTDRNYAVQILYRLSREQFYKLKKKLVGEDEKYESFMMDSAESVDTESEKLIEW